jgi:hypothetical protein
VAGWKIMGSTPDTVVTVTQASSSSAGARIAIVGVFRNVDPADPLQSLGIVALSGTNTSIINPAAITPTQAGTKILVMGAAGYFDTAGTISAGYLSNTKSLQRNNASFCSIALMGLVDWTSGTYDPAAFTVTPDNTDCGWASAVMALKRKP